MSEEKKSQEELDQIEEAILTDAPLSIHLGGQDYLAVSPGERDFIELTEWIRARFISLARLAVSDLTKEERAETISIALRTAMGINWHDDDGLNVLNTSDGLARVGFLMLRKESKNITYPKMQELMLDSDNIAEVARAFQHFQDLAANVKPPADTGEGKRKY